MSARRNMDTLECLVVISSDIMNTTTVHALSAQGPTLEWLPLPYPLPNA